MTVANASEITGYEVAIVFCPEGHLTITATDGNDTVVYRAVKKRCTKRTSPQQMKDMAQAFVDWNWTRVCRDVFEAQGWRCAQCGKMKPLQGHHRKRRSQGRRDTPENIEGRCQECHEAKHRP